LNRKLEYRGGQILFITKRSDRLLFLRPKRQKETGKWDKIIFSILAPSNDNFLQKLESQNPYELLLTFLLIVQQQIHHNIRKLVPLYFEGVAAPDDTKILCGRSGK